MLELLRLRLANGNPKCSRNFIVSWNCWEIHILSSREDVLQILMMSFLFLLLWRLNLPFSIFHVWFCVSNGLYKLFVSILDLKCLIDFVVAILNLLLN